MAVVAVVLQMCEKVSSVSGPCFEYLSHTACPKVVWHSLSGRVVLPLLNMAYNALRTGVFPSRQRCFKVQFSFAFMSNDIKVCKV